MKPHRQFSTSSPPGAFSRRLGGVQQQNVFYWTVRFIVSVWSFQTTWRTNRQKHMQVVWACGVSWLPVLGVWLCWRAITSLPPACRCRHDESSPPKCLKFICYLLPNTFLYAAVQDFCDRTFSPLNAPLLHSGRKGRGPQLTPTSSRWPPTTGVQFVFSSK